MTPEERLEAVRVHGLDQFMTVARPLSVDMLQVVADVMYDQALPVLDQLGVALFGCQDPRCEQPHDDTPLGETHGLLWVCYQEMVRWFTALTAVNRELGHKLDDLWTSFEVTPNPDQGDPLDIAEEFYGVQSEFLNKTQNIYKDIQPKEE